MKDPEFKSKLLSQEPDLEGELQKRLADKSNYKTEEELIKDINIVAKLTANYDTQFILGSPPNYEPSKEDSIAYIASKNGISELEVMYDEMMKITALI